MFGKRNVWAPAMCDIYAGVTQNPGKSTAPEGTVSAKALGQELVWCSGMCVSMCTRPQIHTGKGFIEFSSSQIPPTLELFRDSPGDTEEKSHTVEGATYRS